MAIRQRRRDTNERAFLDEVDPVMVRLVSATTPLIALYRAAALAVMLSDARHAWKRQRIIGVLASHQLVPQPVNVPVLQLALRDLLEHGDISRVVEGWYRAKWPPPGMQPGKGEGG